MATVLGSGDWRGLAWEVALYDDEDGLPAVYAKFFGAGGGGGSTTLNPACRLADALSIGVASFEDRLLYLQGPITKSAEKVSVHLADGSEEQAFLPRSHELPVNHFLAIVDRQPTRLEATYFFDRGGEWANVATTGSGFAYLFE